MISLFRLTGGTRVTGSVSRLAALALPCLTLVHWADMYTQADADLANQNLVLAWNEHAAYLEDTYQHPPMRLAEVEALAAHPPKSLLWVANVLLRYPWRVSEQVLDVIQEHLLWSISAGGDAVLFPELDEAEEWLTSEQARSLARSRNVSNLLVWFMDRFDVTHQRAWDFCHAAMDANGDSLEDISSILAGQRDRPDMAGFPEDMTVALASKLEVPASWYEPVPHAVRQAIKKGRRGLI